MKNTNNSTADEERLGDGDLAWLTLDQLAPHPDNPRTGRDNELDELVRSVRTHGVLEPLLVLPADADGVHQIVAGHRRYAACRKTEVEQVPAMVRDLTPVEVLEAFLAENSVRNDLTVSAEIATIGKLMGLDAGLTPAKLCKRIGKSQQWVRDRMALTVLPARWRQSLDTGELTLAAATAAVTVADLGPDHVDIVCGRLTGHRFGDPTNTVTHYRDDLARTTAFEAAIVKHRDRGLTVFTSRDEVPKGHRTLRALDLDTTQARAHAGEVCHAVLIQPGWGKTPEVTTVCVSPARHRPAGDGAGDGASVGAGGSAIVTSHVTTNDRGRGGSSQARHKSRVVRLAAGCELFARTRNGPSAAELTILAFRALIDTAPYEALTTAATLLGLDRPNWTAVVADADTAAKLARVTGAVACGIGELRAYNSSSGYRRSGRLLRGGRCRCRRGREPCLLRPDRGPDPSPRPHPVRHTGPVLWCGRARSLVRGTAAIGVGVR